MSGKQGKQKVEYANVHAGLAVLSVRERAVVRLAAAGLSDLEITEQLGIRMGTLSTYWARARAKTGVSARSALASAMARDETLQAVRPVLCAVGRRALRSSGSAERAALDALSWPVFVVSGAGLRFVNAMAAERLSAAECDQAIAVSRRGSTVWWSPAGQAFVAWAIGPDEVMGLGVP